MAAVGLGFHHFEDPEYTAKKLVDRLRPGGILFIVDFLPHEALDPHRSAAATVTHHGFTKERVRDIFSGAGAGIAFAMQTMGDGVVFTHRKEGKSDRRSVFIARGQKASNPI